MTELKTFDDLIEQTKKGCGKDFIKNAEERGAFKGQWIWVKCQEYNLCSSCQATLLAYTKAQEVFMEKIDKLQKDLKVDKNEEYELWLQNSRFIEILDELKAGVGSWGKMINKLHEERIGELHNLLGKQSLKFEKEIKGLKQMYKLRNDDAKDYSKVLTEKEDLLKQQSLAFDNFVKELKNSFPNKSMHSRSFIIDKITELAKQYGVGR